MFKSHLFIGIGIMGLGCMLLIGCAGMRQAPTGFIAPGEGLTTQLGFGRGADAGSLYVTTAFPIRLYRIKTVREGHYF